MIFENSAKSFLMEKEVLGPNIIASVIFYKLLAFSFNKRKTKRFYQFLWNMEVLDRLWKIVLVLFVETAKLIFI